MLSTSEETVRRWIRDGKLVAHHESRKGGNQITDEALKDFFSKNKKYQRVALSMGSIAGLSIIPGIGSVVTAMTGAKIAADEAIINRAKKTYEANMKAPNCDNEQSGSDTNLEETAQKLVKNAQDSLNRISSKLKSARERCQELEKEIKELESQEQLAQDTLKIAEQTLSNISKFTACGKNSESSR